MQHRLSIPGIARVFLLFACLHFQFVTQGQQVYIPFQRYSTVDGLSQNQVLSILQDRQGFIWFGTLEGLNRFDGYEFTVFFHNNKDSTSISDNFTSSLLEDRDGALWIGTGGGLNRYNRATNTFTSFVHDSRDKNSISSGLISEMLEDNVGNFWFAFATGYVDYFDPKQNVFTHFEIDKNLSDITALQLDLEGNVWIGSQSGVTVMNTAHQVIRRFQRDIKDNSTLSSNSINDIFRDAEGNMWISTDVGLNLYNATDKSFTHFTHNDHDTNSINVNIVKCVAQDKLGRLWIGMENGGLDIWDRTKNEFYHFSPHESDIHSISDNSIYSIFRDDHDNMWVGTNKSGVNFYDQYRKPFIIYQNITDEETSLSHNKVNAIAEQPGKGFWIATDGGGLNFFDEPNGRFKAYRHRVGDPQSLPGNYLVDVMWDAKDKCLWVATWGAGLARMDPLTGRFKRYKHDDGDPKSIASNNLWCLHMDKDGILYVGTVGNGLSIFDKKTEKFDNYGPDVGLNEENVVAMFRDDHGFLWLGGWGNGVTLMDLSTRKFVPRPAALTIKSDEAIVADSLGRIWVGGTPGMQAYDPKSKTVLSITADDGLPSTNINGIVFDVEGNVWLGTNKGIVKYNLAKKEAHVYSQLDGLPANQFSPRLLRTSNGKMYFGSINGLVVFHPDSIKQNPEVPPVVITDLKIFNKSVFAGGKEKILDKHISETKEIWLDFEKNFITLSFVALNYTSTQANQYAYKLEGFDKEWVTVERQRSATFTSLDPGDYVFRVKASNNDGLWNDVGASLVIHVLPPWWETTLFRLMLVILLGFMGSTFYWYRVRNIANQNIKLSSLVQKRTKELEDLNEEMNNQNQTLIERQEEIQTQNEELKQSQDEVLSQRDIVFEQNRKLEEAHIIIERQNEEILLRNETLEMEVQSRTQELVAYNQQLEQFAFISAHNLRAPVARIMGLGNILDMEAKDPEENRMVYQKMVSTARELDRVVRDLNAILEIRKNNESIISEVKLDDELLLVKKYIEKEMEDTQSLIIADFSKAPKIHSVKPYVESVLQNLLSNAIKYRHPDRRPVITLATTLVNGYVCLTVSDNGLGIDTELFKNKIFNLYQRFHTHVEGKGLGLYLIKTQMLALGGKIELE
ncbi:MAG TPA: two-component regulator propeller domain-containing protein, partial [Chryseolinea sp.]|nr:two-component regulator propeller domain-containing protein [Chryseolinea sp.]